MVSFEDLLNYSLNEEKNKITEEFKKILSEMNQIIDEAYAEVYREYSAKIIDLVNKNNDRIRGEIAKMEIENKRLISKEMDYWIENVKENAKKSLYEFVKTDNYKKGLESIISREVSDGSIIYCSPSDQKSISDIIKKKKISCKIVVDEKIVGGIKIYYPDKSLLKDFTLETILNQVFDDIRDKIAQILFGE
ncbi:V/A-type H+-transporting ATPase subunit E [Sulfurisphaera ohwakuensis]|uniref:A-type ATP synthase subunit E n=1 Tax=Sulfurisphaera ohwakuensis TaxID=69656 RepID=A0A7J9RQU7_SULOH|nr:V/A-type H+-transporting ATPase subunit E [Sulfurisphaera ohwakuensis]